MAHRKNSLDYIISDYVYEFVKREFGETLPIIISAQDLKEGSAVKAVKSLVIATLTMLYHYLEEVFPISKEYIKVLSSELIVGERVHLEPDGYDIAIIGYSKPLGGSTELKFYISYEHKNGRTSKNPYDQLLTYILISSYKMRRSLRKNTQPFAMGFLVNNKGKVINGFIISRYMNRRTIELVVYWPMKNKHFECELDYKILANSVRKMIKEKRSLRKGLKQELRYLYNFNCKI